VIGTHHVLDHDAGTFFDSASDPVKIFLHIFLIFVVQLEHCKRRENCTLYEKAVLIRKNTR
jgi:hypothetical protein